MREIKFRAWDKSNQCMIYPGEENTVFTFINGILSVESLETVWKDGCGEIYERDEFFPVDCELMQFTGLKDKNGKEIYEGDVVTLTTPPDEYYKFIGETKSVIVSFENYTWSFGMWQMSGTYYWGKLVSGQLEVIGNIYENPEQLVKV